MDNTMRGLGFSGVAYSPAGFGGGAYLQHRSESGQLDTDEDFEALMSLALDGMLSPAEAVQFGRVLDESPSSVAAWEQWQAFDRKFQSTPVVEPPADFVGAFETRLRRKERRARVWLGLSVGLVAVAMWGSLVAGLAGASAYVMFSQSGWLSAAVRFLAYFSVAIQTQIAMVVSAVETAVATPQVQGMVLAYTVGALFTLWFWAKFLRRSVQHQEAMSGSS